MLHRSDRASPLASPARLDPPRVSVIIPAFNGAKVIGYTLESLAAQTHANVEWIVIDDASQDGTADVVSRFLTGPGRHGRLLRHETNLGLARSLNHGLRESSGEYVLILHQDIVLVSPRWIETALADFDRFPSLAVVTGYYGIPVPAETDFAQRVFGVLRRQFHWPGQAEPEMVTFSEFKCDLVRRASLRAVGDFPERFRIAGEDLWISYSLQEHGDLILKDFDLTCLQRFTGDAATLRGNLRKEFLFGRVLAGTLTRFRSRLVRGLGSSPYSRSRSLNRASQPLVLLVVVILAMATLLTWNLWVAALLLAVIMARLAYYGARLGPGLARITQSTGRGVAEAFVGSFLGLGSDVAYSAGLLVGLATWGRGATV
jgi:glycosyltransferase involved in cell wall biosynthesis